MESSEKKRDWKKREIYHYTVDFLESIGLNRYEISNFAKPGYESRHNIKYWTGQDYIGLGAAASSYNEDCRYTNTENISDYVKGGFIAEREFINREEKLKEKFMLGLRMSRGVKYNGEFKEKIEMLISKGLIKEEDGFVKLTEKGFDLGNLVFMEFV